MNNVKSCHRCPPRNTLAAAALGLVAGMAMAPAAPGGWACPAGAAGCVTALFMGPFRIRRLLHPPVHPAASAFCFCCLLGLLRMQAAQDGASLTWLSARLQSATQRGTLHVRGTVTGEPQLRSPSTVSLLLAVTEVRFEDQDSWRQVREDTLEMRVWTRRTLDQPEPIHDLLPALTIPTACGATIQAQARFGPHPRNTRSLGRPWMRGRTPAANIRAYWKKVQVLEAPPGNSPMHRLRELKGRLLEYYRTHLPDPVNRLAAGAILGDRGPVRTGKFRGRSIGRLFAHAGIGHVLAVSGLHVGIVAGSLIWILRRFRVPPRWMLLPVGLALTGYFLLTGGRPSTARAVLMTLIGLGLYAFGGSGMRGAAFIGVSAAAMVLLVHQPLLLGDVGFQLSFTAVLSLLLLTRPIERYLGGLSGPALAVWAVWLGLLLRAASTHMEVLLTRTGMVALGLSVVGVIRVARVPRTCIRRRKTRRRGLFTALRRLLAAQIAIHLGLLIPLSGLYFGHFSLAGTLVNLAAIPLIGLFVQAGLLTGVLGLVPGAGPSLAWIPAQLTTLSGMLFFRIAHAGASLFPYPEVPGVQPGLLPLYYGSILFLFRGRRILCRLRRAVHGLRGLTTHSQPQEPGAPAQARSAQHGTDHG